MEGEGARNPSYGPLELALDTSRALNHWPRVTNYIRDVLIDALKTRGSCIEAEVVTYCGGK